MSVCGCRARSWRPVSWVSVFLFVALSLSSPIAAQHKVIGPAGGVDGAILLQDYGSFALYWISEAQLQAARSRGTELAPADDSDLLLIEAGPFDTQLGEPKVPEQHKLTRLTGFALSVIQFVGPIKDGWLDELRDLGVEPVHYIANNGYLVWTDDVGRGSLATLAEVGATVQYAGPWEPWYKLGPTLRDRISDPESDPDEVVELDVQMYRHEDSIGSKTLIAELAVKVLSDWQPLLAFENLIVRVRAADLEAIAALPDVSAISERLERSLFDEVQNQILAGDLDAPRTGPNGPGYFGFLASRGFSTTPADYPIVDITDDGIGNGNVNSGDPTLHQGGSTGNPTRLAYIGNCTAAANGGGPDGHGHINASIAGGYDARSGFPFRDPLGFQRGLGVNPFGRFAGTRIFAPGFDVSACGGTDTGLLKREQDSGALVSSNSWGCSGCAGSYDASSQAFDVGVRDADLTETGNQPLIVVVSAGNSGPGAGTVGTPANGKNVITVGASESDRPNDEDGTWIDGCGIGAAGADNAMDVISFSSRGPAPGNRRKPELIAPGTHIQGTASTNAGYTGNGVCDPLRPGGQTTFAASSGTSHSTPAVSGLSSLIYWWIANDQGNFDVASLDGVPVPPSPAMIKAYLMAHPTYLTGVGANDSLPSNSQGYGMPNMDLLFDDAEKALLDQTTILGSSGESWVWAGAVADPSKPVRIALAYTDQAGAIGVSPQVNNLNLTATVGGVTYLGNVFNGAWSASGGIADAVNNYEAVFLPAGTSGALQFTISAFNIAGDGVPGNADTTDQDFAVVCYNCAANPTFTMSVSPSTLNVCKPSTGQATITIGSVLGYSSPVTLSSSGQPAGSTVSFNINPVTPPGASTLTFTPGTAAVGSYALQLTGSGGGGSITQMRNLPLNLFSMAPGAVSLLSPANGSSNQPLSVSFGWSAAAQTGSYNIQISTNPTFTAIIDSATVAGTSYVSTALDNAVQYYWRVRSVNACGNGAYSSTFSFVTVPAPGQCAAAATPMMHLQQDFEAGFGGWTHSAVGTDTWALSGARTRSGVNAAKAVDIATISDQYLVSPAVTLPSAGQAPLTLKFWNYQSIEDNNVISCYDGAVLEISNNGGSSWTRLEAELLTDPYDGPISSSFGNPLADQNAWCGDPQDWLQSIVDIDAWAGQTVRFRFRLATDSSESREGWYIDDVVVQSCVGAGIFIDGFETGNASAWSGAVP